MKQRFITRGAYKYYVKAKVYEEKSEGDEVYEINASLVFPNRLDLNLAKDEEILKSIIRERGGVTVLKITVTGIMPIQLRVPFEDFVAAAVKYEREKEASKDAEVYEDDMEG